MLSFNVYFTKMFGFVLCLVLVLFEAEAQLLENDFSEIRLRYSFKNKENYTVLKDKPLQIVIENANARYIWCNSFYENNETKRYLQFVPATSFSTHIYSILNIAKVTAEMNTKWKCTVLNGDWDSKLYEYKGRNYTLKEFIFNVHVKRANFSVIRLSYSFKNKENYTVLKDKPLKIVIENVNARIIWCNSFYVNKETGRYLQFVPETNLATDIYSILNITNVTAEMNTKWKCTVFIAYWAGKSYKHTTKDILFQVHVKGLKQVILEVNDHNLDYNDLTIDQSDDFYGSATYTFQDGEEVELSCKKAPNIDSSDTLRLEYFNAKGNCLFKTNDIKPNNKTMLKFRSVMKSTNDKYYLDCIWASTNPYRENRYRVTFNVKKDYAKQPAIIMSVNGQNLTSLNESYTFKFVNGEILDVTCKINEKDYPIGSLYFNNDSNITLEAQKEAKCISLKYVKPSHIQNQYFTCSIHNTEVENPNARLIFSSDIPDYEVRIRGLPRNNFLYQYTNNLNQWTIEYQYSIDETINLTCVGKEIRDSSQSPIFKWEHKGEPDTPSEPQKDRKIPSIRFTEPFTRKLNETHNGSKIRCIYYPDRYDKKYTKIAEIILRLKPKLISKEKMDEATRNSVLAKDQDPDAKPLEKDTVFDMLVPIAVTIGVIVAVITMVCLVLWRKRTKRANLIENNYDNFSNENDSPIPAFPSQWETNYDDSDYAKTYEEVRHENYSGATDDDKLYKLPYNRESNISENHYFEIDELFNTKPDGLAASWNSAQSSNHNKDLNTPKERSHNSNTAIYNNTIDSKLSGYDQLVHHSLPVNESNENYSSVQSKGKNKSVTFRDMSNDLGRRYYSEGNARQDSRKYEPRLKQNSAGQYANTNQDITYMQPGDMPKKYNNGDMRKISNYESGDMLKKSNFENHFPENKKTVNPLDLEPELLDGDFEISCKNELYG